MFWYGNFCETPPVLQNHVAQLRCDPGSGHRGWCLCSCLWLGCRWGGPFGHGFDQIMSFFGVASPPSGWPVPGGRERREDGGGPDRTRCTPPFLGRKTTVFRSCRRWWLKPWWHWAWAPTRTVCCTCWWRMGWPTPPSWSAAWLFSYLQLQKIKSQGISRFYDVLCTIRCQKWWQQLHQVWLANAAWSWTCHGFWWKRLRSAGPPKRWTWGTPDAKNPLEVDVSRKCIP